MTMEYLEFPKMLVHADLPPAIAQTPDDEVDLMARGYAPAGRSDPAAYDRVMAGEIPGYEPQTYPKMVGDKIVQSREEEAEIKPPGPVEGAPDEWAAFRAWKAEQAAGKPAETAAPTRRISAQEEDALAEIEAADRAASKPKRLAKVA